MNPMNANQARRVFEGSLCLGIRVLRKIVEDVLMEMGGKR